MGIRIRHLSKSFDRLAVLDAIDLEIFRGELLALLGPSGSGKTTLLRIIAGLEYADSGQVLFGNEETAGMSVQSRKVGFVFQHYALFKHMDVFENIAFGLRVRRGKARWPEVRIRTRVEELLALVQLQGIEKRYPLQLSGGQRQRVALARALAIEPRVLLLDEPFGALDAQVRRDLRRWLRELHQRTGLTTVFVTHDQAEALELADRVAILNRGRIEQIDTPEAVYDRPASPFVYDFVGMVNRIPGYLDQGQLQVAGQVLQTNAVLPSGPVDIYVRPEDLVPDPSRGWPAIVTCAQRNGAWLRLRATLVAAGGEVEVELPISAGRFQAGQQLCLIARSYGIFPAASG